MENLNFVVGRSLVSIIKCQEVIICVLLILNQWLKKDENLLSLALQNWNSGCGLHAFSNLKSLDLEMWVTMSFIPHKV